MGQLHTVSKSSAVSDKLAENAFGVMKNFAEMIKGLILLVTKRQVHHALKDRWALSYRHQHRRAVRYTSKHRLEMTSVLHLVFACGHGNRKIITFTK